VADILRAYGGGPVDMWRGRVAREDEELATCLLADFSLKLFLRP
jgi:hypothetical protein